MMLARATHQRSNDNDVVAGFYLTCKEEVVRQGFAWEIDWQTDAVNSVHTEPEVLAEGGWTILSAGISEQVIKKVFNDISLSFLSWQSAREIVDHSVECKISALRRFASPWKIDAILRYVESVARYGWQHFLSSVRLTGAHFLRDTVRLGPVTSIHLAKNLGCNVAKPDRHLLRISSLFQYKDPNQLCRSIADVTGEKMSVIDVVLWRYAVLYPDYPEQILREYSIGGSLSMSGLGARTDV